MPAALARRRLLTPRLLAPLLAALAVLLLAASGAAAATRANVRASADSTVREDRPNWAPGTSPRLRVAGDPLTRAYARFRLRRLANVVQRVILRLYVRRGSRGVIEVRGVSGRRWSERTLTWKRRPALRGPVVAGRAVPRRGGWISLDVTPLVRRNGDVSLALTAPGRRAIVLASREVRSRAPRMWVRSFRDVQPRYPVRAAFYLDSFPSGWATRYHPSLGGYDSASAAVEQEHVRAMRYAGLNAAIVSWGGPFDGATEPNVTRLLATTSAMGSRFRWGLATGAEAAGDPDADAITSTLRYVVDHHGRDPAYLRVSLRPVVFVALGLGDGCARARPWVRAARSLRVWLVLSTFPGSSRCGYRPNAFYPGAALDGAQRGGSSFVVSPGIYAAGAPGPQLVRDLPRFRGDVSAMAASRARWQLVASFNDWSAGTAVESATEWATRSRRGAYLDVLHDVLAGSEAERPPSPSDPVAGAAGDIACDPAYPYFNGGAGTPGYCQERATSDLLLAMHPSVVLPLGDEQYENGTAAGFEASYAPTWGRLRSISRPVPGNHEYQTPGATPYFDYFNGIGAAYGRAGARGQGWYSFDLGRWHLIALNSNCAAIGGCGVGSPQETWLRNDLAAYPAACVLSYWHQPLFTSGGEGPTRAMRPLFQDLYQAGAELVLNGHDHDYERFAPQTSLGAPDPSGGIREFVVGTGGKTHLGWGRLAANSQVRDNTTFGVLRVTLHPESYDWEVVPEPGGRFTDRGSGDCH